MAKDELDRIVDSAVRDFGAVEPPPGLESRVLNRVRFEEARRPWATRPWTTMWYWALAGSAALAGMVTLWVWPQANAPNIPLPSAVVAAKRESPPPAFTTTLPKRVAAAHHHARTRASSQHLSAEESALVALVSAHPEEAVSVVADLRQKLSAPFQIASLSIAPIEIKSLSEEKNQ